MLNGGIGQITFLIEYFSDRPANETVELLIICQSSTRRLLMRQSILVVSP